jgi:hypothetical protein
MRGTARRNDLITQRLEVALVYKDMLGLAEAMAYLEQEGIPKAISERVLLTQQRRHVVDAAGVPNSSKAQFVNCRRKNRVHDAIVEAALKIETKLGTEWARTLLKQEKVVDDVAARIFADGPRQLRAKRN